MAENSKIEWTQNTGSPWLGCTEVSPGCLNCYARELTQTRLEPIMRKAYKAAGFSDWETRPVWGDKATRVLTKGFWTQAIQADRRAAKAGVRVKHFPSLDDFLDECPAGIITQSGEHLEPVSVLADLLKLIHDTPNLDWLLLTKRPENWFSRLAKLPLDRYPTSLQRWVMAWLWGDPPPSNVWLGTTVEDQKRADERIPELLKIPAKVRFLSVEPMLEEISLVKAYPDELSACSHGNCRHWGIGDAMRECVECGGREENPDNGDCAKCKKGTMRDICPKCQYNDISECYERPEDFAEGYEVLPGIHWVIGGLESGPKRRWGAGIEGLRSMRDQCRAAGVSFFCKQVDKVQPIPEDLMIREFPKV